jgi:hypothetical protein
MGQAEQLQNAANDLNKAAGIYSATAGEIAQMAGHLTGVVYSLKQLNSGQYVDAAINAWKRGSRDAFRVMDALTATATAMTTLASGIEAQIPAVQKAENQELFGSGSFANSPLISAKNGPGNIPYSPQYLATEQASKTALSEVETLSKTFVSTVGSSALPHVVGACSTGNEPLGPGQTDGTDLVITIDDNGQLKFGPADGSWDETGGGGGGGGGGGNGTGGDNGGWDRYCTNPLSGEEALLGNSSEALSKLGLTWKITKTGAAALGVNTFVSTAYSTQLIPQVGIGSVFFKNIAGGVVMSAVDGYAFINAANNWDRLIMTGKSGNRYRLANCSGPLMIIQALLGASSGMAFQYGLKAVTKK